MSDDAADTPHPQDSEAGADRSRRDRAGRADHADRADNTDRSDIFDLAGTDPELLHSGRIPDPLPDHTPLFRWMARVLSSIEARLRARGGQSFRAITRITWAAVAVIGVFLLFGPVLNAPRDFDDILESADIEEVDWIARDVALDYRVDRTEHGEFTAEVHESFTTFFINEASASEITRAVVTEFKGHDVDFDLHEVTIDGKEATARITRNPSMTTIHISLADGTRLSGKDHRVELSYDLQNLVVTETDEATNQAVDQWSWPLFADWPQATSGIEASFTFSPEVHEAMVRPPRAYVGWLLIAGTQWLTPEATTAEGVRYSFSNDDNLPANADFWIHASFAPGTFVQPPTTPLFWLQSWGPLLPLPILGALLLFGFAARRIVWADSAGAPWYLARSTPPESLAPEEAAQFMRKPWHAELVSALSSRPGRPRPRRSTRKRGSVRIPEVVVGSSRETWLADVARTGRRAGRLGTLPSVIGRREAWRVQRPDRMLEQGLRWVPDSYLRDTFIFAPLAIALVQWGILRQLSHQVILTVLWFPGLIVLLSTVLALLTVWAVLRPRPLTPHGALVMQELKGIDAFARATRLIARGPLDDPLLPYAVLFESARRSGDLATEQAVIETGDRGLARGWRTRRYISGPAFLAMASAVAILAGAIVTASTLTSPYAHDTRYATDFGSDLPGLLYTQTRGFDVEAELTRGADGEANLRVTERLDVEFDGGGARVPQFAREWPASRLGQDLGLQDITLTIDGAAVPTVVEDHSETSTRYVLTQLREVLDGVHEVEVSYVLARPVVALDRGADTVDELRWTALLSFWEDTYYTTIGRPFDGSAPVRPIRLQFTLAAELVDAVQQGGWIDSDYERPRNDDERGNWLRPWTTEAIVYLGEDGRERFELQLGSEARRADGALVATFDADEVKSRPMPVTSGGRNAAPWAVDARVNAELESYDLQISSDDLGVRIEFAPGTFAGISTEASSSSEALRALPYTILLALAGIVILAAIIVTGYAARLRSLKQPGSSSFALISFGAIPVAMIAQCVLFFWAIGPASGSDPRIPAAMTFGGIMIVGVIVAMIAAGSAMADPKAATATGAAAKRRG